MDDEEYQYYPEYEDNTDSITEAINEAIYSDDIEKAKYILCLDNFTNVSKNERESGLFISAYVALIHNNRAQNILKYLLLEYDASENISIDKIYDEQHKLFVKKFLNSKILNDDLKIELNQNEKEKLNKKIKV
jgi:hypothetical protein